MNISDFVCVGEEDPEESFRIIPSSAYHSMVVLCKDGPVDGDKTSADEKSCRILRSEYEEFVHIDASDLIQSNEKMSKEELLGLICREFEQIDIRCFRISSCRRLVKTLFKSSIDPVL